MWAIIIIGPRVTVGFKSQHGINASTQDAGYNSYHRFCTQHSAADDHKQLHNQNYLDAASHMERLETNIGARAGATFRVVDHLMCLKLRPAVLPPQFFRKANISTN